MKLNKSTILFMLAALVVGVVLGSLLFGGESEQHQHSGGEATVWTCSMHPQIRQNKPGKCPICGMELIPLSENKGKLVANDALQMSESAIALANVQTVVVGSGEAASKNLQLSGKIEADERNVSLISAHFNGRIEKLYVNFTGEKVKRGQVLASIYSPEFIMAQQELLEAAKNKDSNPELYNAVRNKLKNFQLAESEINKIEAEGKVSMALPLRSHYSGVVQKLYASSGKHVKKGEPLFGIVDLSKLWVVLDAYEQDLGRISEGDVITFTVPSLPGESFKAKVTFIDPFIDPSNRVAGIRAEVVNAKGKLKPEMFVKATVLNGEKQESGEVITIPQSAVLWTGKRSLVYVKLEGYDQPTFEYREVVLGPEKGNQYLVESGLSAGDRIVVNGTFSIDAAAQLAGKPSMMNPKEKTESVKLSAGANAALQSIIKQYFLVKNALVNDDFNQAQAETKSLQQTVNNVEMEVFEGDAHMIWMKYVKSLKTSIEAMAESKDIDQLREKFILVSKNIIALTQQMKPESSTLYVQHCPMADNNQGADWLSAEKEVKNPYFGAFMLSCGEVTQVMN
ncbi:efflux RND transporter periplasmic adaptor subunit [Fulvivirga maritima]|uniref:efflux RND transporter periplasmic adaptor subunit n=1 Tax=Fulvivirga maritima TaxID=2904247 RepID=UPI001F460AC4|nr:efflux RND transporter periplasmic adaptor subunit [Fulvivirga maritima]UII27347.1 efflux RND transporter periplasmic adaptor subunit [Fulvivirga maritima]